MDRLLLTLRYYATGSFIITVADFIGVSKVSAFNFIKLVTNAIASLRKDYVKLPESQLEVNEGKKKFFKIAKFPNAIAAIDCTHIKILPPGKEI